MEQENAGKQQVLERKAELTVDERFKSKNEAIKAYFDSNITRILLNTGASTNDKIVDLGREIVSLKLLQQRQEHQMQMIQAENESLDLSLAHQKDYNQQLQLTLREA